MRMNNTERQRQWRQKLCEKQEKGRFLLCRIASHHLIVLGYLKNEPISMQTYEAQCAFVAAKGRYFKRKNKKEKKESVPQ